MVPGRSAGSVEAASSTVFRAPDCDWLTIRHTAVASARRGKTVFRNSDARAAALGALELSEALDGAGGTNHSCVVEVRSSFGSSSNTRSFAGVNNFSATGAG